MALQSTEVALLSLACRFMETLKTSIHHVPSFLNRQKDLKSTQRKSKVRASQLSDQVDHAVTLRTAMKARKNKYAEAFTWVPIWVKVIAKRNKSINHRSRSKEIVVLTESRRSFRIWLIQIACQRRVAVAQEALLYLNQFSSQIQARSN